MLHFLRNIRMGPNKGNRKIIFCLKNRKTLENLSKTNVLMSLVNFGTDCLTVVQETTLLTNTMRNISIKTKHT